MAATDLLGLPVRWPIVGAPMAGGPSTPRLAAAVSGGGGLGFLAAGYLSAEEMTRQIGELRALTDAPFGVNVFVPQSPDVDEAAVTAFVASLQAEAEAFGVPVVPSWDDDGWAEKLEQLRRDAVPLVSFTFGCPFSPPAPVLTRWAPRGSRLAAIRGRSTTTGLRTRAGAFSLS
jgi:nitronate monooxygenase